MLQTLDRCARWNESQLAALEMALSKGEPKYMAQTCRAILHCLTGHRALKSVTEKLRGVPHCFKVKHCGMWFSCDFCVACPHTVAAVGALQTLERWALTTHECSTEHL